MYFVHVYWSPDEAKVGVLTTGFNGWELAFDVASGRRIQFDEIRKDFADSIRKSYQVPASDDPLSWAESAEACEEFFKLHPEIKLSYR